MPGSKEASHKQNKLHALCVLYMKEHHFDVFVKFQEELGITPRKGNIIEDMYHRIMKSKGEKHHDKL